MSSFLQHYKLVLHTEGPVFVGSGKELNKKEYLLDRYKKEILVFDIGKMCQGLERMHFGRKFENYLLGNDKIDGKAGLYQWFKSNKISAKDYLPWVKYRLSCGDFLLEKNAINVFECIKDSYNNPYIPGSSLKGMLRTILLSYMAHNAEECEKWGWHINGAMREYKGPNKFLKEQIGEIETSIFHTIQRRDERGKPVKNMNAVNDMMSGLVVSDSEPLSIEDLVLCQKADENLDGKSHNINMLRESIRPGVDICFSLTIDSQICSITKQNIMDAGGYFSDQYYNNYLSKFKSTDYPGNSTVWLGGGSGFHTKTIINSVFEEKQALSATTSILSKKKDSKNRRDAELGVSPHILKCTEFEGKRYQFGQCRMEID